LNIIEQKTKRFIQNIFLLIGGIFSMKYIKSIVKSCLNKLGFSVEKSRVTPYFDIYQKPRFTEYDVNLVGHTFRIVDSRSFYFGYDEIFTREVYKFKCSSTTPTIIDCGANVGLSVVYFKSIFPAANITAIEADPKIFKILSQNCKHLDVQLLQKAVSNSHEPLKFFCEDTDGGRVTEVFQDAKESVTVETVMLDDLISGPVDFLKIDIEGAEAAALAACHKLHLVDQIFIEYHSFANPEQYLNDILEKLKKEGFRYYIHEQFCSKKPLSVARVHMDMDLQLNIFGLRRPPASII